MTFRQAERVRKRAEYQQIYDRGVKVNSRAFTLFRFANGLEVGRLGIAATRKLGGAVVRNRAKRLVREVFRRNKLAPGFDIVIVPRRELLDTGLIALEREFRNSLERSARASTGSGQEPARSGEQRRDEQLVTVARQQLQEFQPVQLGQFADALRLADLVVVEDVLHVHAVHHTRPGLDG